MGDRVRTVWRGPGPGVGAVPDAVQLLEATVLLGRHQHDIDMEQKLKAKVISLKKEKQQVITGR